MFDMTMTEWVRKQASGLAFATLVMTLGLSACRNETDAPADRGGEDLRGKLLVLCEGNFGRTPGGLYSFDPDRGSLTGEFFEPLNGYPAGNVVHSAWQSPAGRRLWVVVNNSGWVLEIDPASGRVLRRIEGLRSPRQVRQLATGSLLITDFQDEALTFADPQNGRLVDRIRTPGWSEALTLTPDGSGRWLLASRLPWGDTRTFGETMRVLSPEGRPVDSLTFGKGCHEVLCHPSGWCVASYEELSATGAPGLALWRWGNASQAVMIPARRPAPEQPSRLSFIEPPTGTNRTPAVLYLDGGVCRLALPITDQVFAPPTVEVLHERQGDNLSMLAALPFKTGAQAADTLMFLVGDSRDYQRPGVLRRYRFPARSTMGLRAELVDTFPTGVIPGYALMIR